MESFYDSTLTTMFVNITQNGTSLSRTFLQLFPDIVLSSEPKTQVYLYDVSENIHRKLIKRGAIDDPCQADMFQDLTLWGTTS